MRTFSYSSLIMLCAFKIFSKSSRRNGAEVLARIQHFKILTKLKSGQVGNNPLAIKYPLVISKTTRPILAKQKLNDALKQIQQVSI